MRKRSFISLRMKAERKCERSRNSYLWQSRQSERSVAELRRQSVSGEAELPIFGSQGRAQVRKRNFTSLGVQAEMTCGSGTSNSLKVLTEKVRKRNLRSLEVLAERRAELQIFASQGRADVPKLNLRSLAVNAGRKCGTELHIFSSQDRAETELQFFGSQGRAEVWDRNFRSLAVKTKQKCGSRI